MKHRVKPLLVLTIAASSIVAAAATEPAICLVAGHAAGRIQSFTPGAPDAEIRAFAEALPVLNAMAEGPDGFLYVTTGAPAQSGAVVRIDPKTGIPSGTFWNGIAAEGKAVGRLTGIVAAGKEWFVAEAEAGKIHRLDMASGAWLGVAAEVPGALISQICLSGDGLQVANPQGQETRLRVGPKTPPSLLAADFNGQRILRLPRNADGGFEQAQVLHSTAPSAPWAVVEDAKGRIFYSTNAGAVFRLDGEAGVQPWITGEPAQQVIYLGLSKDQAALLATSNQSGWVSAWPTAEAAAEPLWKRRFPATDTVVSAVLPSNPSAVALQTKSLHLTGAPGATPAPGWLVKAMPEAGLITHLGWDTEGGNREIHNLLRRPLEFRLSAGGGDAPLSIQELDVAASGMSGRLCKEEGTAIGTFQMALKDGVLDVSAMLDAGQAGDGARLSLILKLNPRVCSTSFHATGWTSPDTGRLPGLMIAPDMGTMEVTSPASTEVVFNGSRPLRETTLSFRSPAGAAPELSLKFAPVHLANPAPGANEDLWRKVRRGWWNLPIATSQWGPADNTDGSIAGVWGNNVISNPVGSTLFWLADHILLQPEWSGGVDGSDFLRHTVEYHLKNKILPGGEVAYVNLQPGAMDANPALIIAFWAFVEATGDLDWMRTWWPKLAPAIAYMEARDVDGDGLVESKQSGNPGTGAFGDTAWDTYSSGHKNAYVNALAHRAFKCLAALAAKSGDAAAAAGYTARAAKLKAAFRPVFYNPETGWLAWWKSEGGTLHDVHSDVPTSLATVCGLLEPADAKGMLDKYWAALRQSGFNNFALGLPLNYRPVPAAWQFQSWGGANPDGSDTFQKYLNGGCTVSNTLWFLTASYMTGDDERANMILDKMVERQHAGVFPNGGGFQNGVVDIYPYGAEFYDWSGKTCGYEGHLVYSWTFLQAIPLRDPALRQRLYGFLRE